MKKLFKGFISRYQPNEKIKSQTNSVQEKYRKSGLTLEQAITIKEKIEQALETDRLYRNNSLGLGQLSEYINVDRYKVSEVINTQYAKNFYNLLNSYRIGEAKELLVSSPLLSVKCIMYEVGFNSKNSFYSAFKKDTGLSPNDFRSMESYTYQSPQLAS